MLFNVLSSMFRTNKQSATNKILHHSNKLKDRTVHIIINYYYQLLLNKTPFSYFFQSLTHQDHFLKSAYTIIK